MDARMLAQGLATGRIALGLAMFLAPTRASRAWLGDDAARPGAAMAVRGLGARDVAIGLGTIAALARDEDAGRWLEAAIVADVADASASLLASHADRSRFVGALVGGTAAVLGLSARRRLA